VYARACLVFVGARCSKKEKVGSVISGRKLKKRENITGGENVSQNTTFLDWEK
jgi:hypothetical protein